MRATVPPAKQLATNPIASPSRRWIAVAASTALLCGLALTGPPATTAFETGRAETVRCTVPDERREPVSRARTDEREVSITFDEPIGRLTERILDSFSAYRMRGTFYAVGDEVVRHPHASREILERGHELGNHTFEHEDVSMLPDFGFATMQAANRTIRDRTGFRPCTFRPPGLAYNRRALRAASSLRLTTVTATRGNDVFTADSAEIAEYALDGIRPGDIILMHQVEPSADALPRILRGLRARNLRSVPVAELLGGRLVSGTRRP